MENKEKEENKGINAYTLFLILILLILSEDMLIQLLKFNKNQIKKGV